MFDPLRTSSLFKTSDSSRPIYFWQPTYDRVNYAAAGASSVSLFTVPKGQTATLIRNGSVASITKTARDTNMENAGVIPSKQIHIYGISLGYIHLTEGAVGNAADRDKLRGSGVFTLKTVSDRIILQLPLIYLPEVNPITAASNPTSGTATIIAQSGGGGFGVPMYNLTETPAVIEANQNFSVTLDFDGSPTLTNAVDICVALQGVEVRPS